MGGSMGTSSSTQNTSQKSKTAPWAPTVDPLKEIVGGISGEYGNYTPTGAENSALDQLMQNAQAGNPWTKQISGLAGDLLSGGPDRTGMVKNAYSQYQKQARPYLDQNYLDPYKNPAMQDYLQTTSNDIQSRLSSMYAGAGRDPSGAGNFGGTLARGITEGTAPIFANQYNQNVATQRGMMDNLYNAGNTSAGALSGLDQLSLGNRAQGVGAAGAAMDAKNYGPNAILQAQAMKRGLPLANLGQLSSLLLPIAGLGSQSKGTASSVGTQTMSPMQQINGWMGMAGNLGKTMTGFNSGIGGLAQLGSAFGGMFK